MSNSPSRRGTARDSLTLDDVRSRLLYNPETGKLYWKMQSPDIGENRTFNKRFAGKEAGYLNNGYVVINLFQIKYRAHRLAWLLSYGSFPSMIMDHINGIRSDNRLANLREVNAFQSTQNRGRKSGSASGFKGVSRGGGTSKKWVARITHNGQDLNLGAFETKEEARSVYIDAAKRLHGEFARF